MKTETLAEARQALLDAKLALKAIHKLQMGYTHERFDELLELQEFLILLSNRFFELIPFQNTSHSPLSVLDAFSVEQELSTVENLCDYEAATKIIMAAL